MVVEVVDDVGEVYVVPAAGALVLPIYKNNNIRTLIITYSDTPINYYFHITSVTLKWLKPLEGFKSINFKCLEYLNG